MLRNGLGRGSGAQRQFLREINLAPPSFLSADLSSALLVGDRGSQVTFLVGAVLPVARAEQHHHDHKHYGELDPACENVNRQELAFHAEDAHLALLLLVCVVEVVARADPALVARPRQRHRDQEDDVGDEDDRLHGVVAGHPAL